jgi:hypothetical protein
VRYFDLVSLQSIFFVFENLCLRTGAVCAGMRARRGDRRHGGGMLGLERSRSLMGRDDAHHGSARLADILEKKSSPQYIYYISAPQSTFSI